MVKLTKKEKEEMCIELGKRLCEIRKLLHMSQTEFGDRVGFSKLRIVEIETGKRIMTWSHLTSIICLCFMNRVTKEYFYLNRVLGPKYFQFMQQKGELYPPELNIIVDPSILAYYEELVREYISSETRKKE